MAANKSLHIADPFALPEEQKLESYRLLKRSLDSALNTVLVRRRGPTHPLRIFMFHAVVSQPFEVPNYCYLQRELYKQHLELIKRYYKVLPLSEAVLKMQAGELTEPTAVITFDDGFHNNYTLAFPELKRMRLPATVFVSTGFTDTDQTPWFCRVLRAVSETKNVSLDWNDSQHDLSGEAEKSNTARVLMRQLKQLPQKELESETDSIERLLGFEARRPVDSASPYRMLSSRAIREMADSGLVEFGGHTCSHSILSQLSVRDQQQEIQSSIDFLSNLLGRPCTLFAYPNGLFEDYDGNSIECLQQAGVSTALTAVSGVNQWFDSSLELRREGLGPPDSKWKLEQRIRSMIEDDRPPANP